MKRLRIKVCALGIVAGLLLLAPARADDSGLCPAAGPLMADLAPAMMAQVVPLGDPLEIPVCDGWVQNPAAPLASLPAWQILTALTDPQSGGMVLPDRWAGFGQLPASAGREWPRLFEPAPASAGLVDVETLPVQRLVPRLRKAFEAEGVPEKWIWVAEVESTFNPRARSLAGAAGLYQLMPATARRFGLRTFPFDDRLVPEKNARAAARYLKTLYQQFESWPLALAAYNAGEGRIVREMKKRGARTYGEIVRHLPLETQVYVPRVMATAALREDQTAGLVSALAVDRKAIRGEP